MWKLSSIVIAMSILLLSGMTHAALFDVTAPGDIIQGVPNNGNWPGAEGPPLAIDDNVETKYLHFNGDFDPDVGPTGFQVTPSVGQSTVTGLTFTTANDNAPRDPVAFELYGSNVSIDGPYTLIVSGDIVDFSQGVWPRQTMNETPILFDNETAYDHYQLLFTDIRDRAAANSMQIAEVELLIIMLKAYNPVPADGALHSETWANLQWTAGNFAVSHDLYFGDNLANVEAGTAETFRGNLSSTYLVVGFPGFPYPNGLVPGTTYYWRIDEVNDLHPDSPWKGNIWSFTVPPRKAYNPNPSGGFVYPDVTLSWTAGMLARLHHVYFGDNFDDVNDGTGGTYKGPVAGPTYTPGTLAKDMMYYWRVDEFDGAITYRGDVWSFSTIPTIAVTDPNLVCWWKLDEGSGTITVDYSGYEHHGTLQGDPQWAAGYAGGALDFDGTGDYVNIDGYKGILGSHALSVTAWIKATALQAGTIVSWGPQTNGQILGLWVNESRLWCLNGGNAISVQGNSTVTDGEWHHVAVTVKENATISYPDVKIYVNGRNDTIATTDSTAFNLVADTEDVSIGRRPASNQTLKRFFNGLIDDVRIYDTELTVEEIKLAMRSDTTLAWNPSPVNGSTPYIRDAMPLSWSPGDKASQHDVYFGTDQGTVFDSDSTDTTGIYRGLQSTTIYNPPEGVEWGGGPYYWRVDENNTDGTVSKGSVWSFTVADFLKIEDFEDYNDFEPDRIFDTWSDGWGVATNGSEVGYADPNFTLGEHHVETTIVHGGFQSLPYFFDNNFKYSEASLTLVSARNWTEEGVAVLSLWFYGDPSNAAEQMYVSISNANGATGTVYHDNPAAAQIATWTQWTIDLQKFADQGVNLTNVDKFYIGFGDKANLQAGGTGKMYFDDICLKRPTESLAGPTP